jgi:hypothetical protein
VDKRLLETMRDSPDSTINESAAAIGKSRTVTALHRLRERGPGGIGRRQVAAG